MTTTSWLLRVLAFCVLVSVLSHEPRAKPLPVQVAACKWGRDTECCIQPPRVLVTKLADLRAERWAR